MKVLLCLVAAFVVMGSMILGGCLGDATCNGGGASEDDPLEELQILSHRMVIDPLLGYATVTGNATNVSGRHLGRAQVEVVFYDSSGASIGTGSDHTDNLDSGQIWEFEVFFFQRGTTTYDVGMGSTW